MPVPCQQCMLIVGAMVAALTVEPCEATSMTHFARSMTHLRGGLDNQANASSLGEGFVESAVDLAKKLDLAIEGAVTPVAWRASTFLQTVGSAFALTKRSKHKRKQQLDNIMWLHIPKTGTSFIGTVWGYACGRGQLPIDLAVDGNARPGCNPCYDFALMDRYPRDLYCQAGVLHPHFHTQHQGLNMRLQEQGANYVGLFRRPSQRIISAYRAHHVSGFNHDAIDLVMNECRNSLDCWARWPGMAGCMTRMLSGKLCNDAEALARNASANAEELKASLPVALENMDKMPFVGLTEEWDESVCLWHLMFGQRLYLAEFKDMHRSRKSSEQAYNENELGGFIDEADEAVYRAAEQRFKKLVTEHAGPGNTACEALGLEVYNVENSSNEEGVVFDGDEAVEVVNNHAGSCEQCTDSDGRNIQCGTCGGHDCGACPATRLFYKFDKETAMAEERQHLKCEANRCRTSGDESDLSQLFQWKLSEGFRGAGLIELDAPSESKPISLDITGAQSPPELPPWDVPKLPELSTLP